MEVTTGVSAVDTALVWGGAISILVGGGTALWRLIRAAAHLFRRTSQFLDDWYGEEGRPGVPARLGVMERVSGMEERLGHVWHEVYPNNGSSLRDAVDQANERLALLCPDVDPDPPQPTAPAAAPDDPAGR
ncbi:hypothetical protein ABT255_03635 [Streptomyces mirabilis]|uniref:hypothetical protein n=1 Tax=Streptomyces mirabilis TaxID=68239 RepID=UPI003322A4F8